MTEVRCAKCRRLLFKVIEWPSVKGEFEIKCPKCGYLDEIVIRLEKAGNRVEIYQNTNIAVLGVDPVEIGELRANQVMNSL